jgi:hypothetical protein
MKTNIYSTNTFAWIDFRIFHVFSNDYEQLYNKLYELSIRNYEEKSIYFPGNLEVKKNIVDSINWRFLGGFFILDKNSIINLTNETSKLVSNMNRISWEVNIWAILEYNNIFNFGWYFADHNNLLILNL